ncbi:hypothetical protein EGJ71_18635 [Stutzerimonas stutzeri]|uniref:hypothetical protein n=1 Tax=Stutzerimonas stutzeri TaxID=316 RepID=UPI000F76B69E|nr:hypothetical protein [Stutzerimonas stutzeri]RRW10719.1 hypothetical protein EGJ71_18635 [Stutzerimonas stutzeri]
MSEHLASRALSDRLLVKEFSSRLLDLVGIFHAELQNISMADKAFAGSGYGVLMEVYGLRTRAYILMNDSGNHVVNSLDFSQEEMLSVFDRISKVARVIDSLTVASSMVLSVATFTVSLGKDRARIVNFLFNALRHDVAEWEALFN